MPPSIYDWVKKEETRFDTEEIQVGENWSWNFRKHVQLIFHLKNGIFYTGENNWLRAFKAVMEPILQLAYWTEDLEVKDTTFFIEESDDRVLSFLIKKYHDEVYVRDHDLDKMYDDITESDLDYGGVLVQKGVDAPEVLKLNSIAFCDQTDVMGGPIAFKHYFSPDKLRSMAKFGWGSESNGATVTLDELCLMATFDKEANGMKETRKNKIPGKVIEIYVVRGNMPMHYLKDDDDMETYKNQLQIIAFYTDKDHNKVGVTLYRKQEDEGNLMFFTSKEVPGRALGRGQGEMLLHNQIWTNFLEIHKMGMLEASSKVLLQTDDESYTTRNKIQDMENLEITTVGEGKKIGQIPTAAPTNVQLFEGSINTWYQHAQLMGSAFDPILGQEASSGTTFRGQERTVAQGRGLHDRRRGQRAKFIEQIYRDLIIPDIKKEVIKSKKFLATLSTDELTWLAEQVATNMADQNIKQMVFAGQMPFEEDRQKMIADLRAKFIKKGNKHLLEILKDEFRDKEVRMGINIAGKQKNLANLSDKILSIFQYIFQNPAGFQQAMQIPALAKSFEDILEFSGLNQVDFVSLMNAPQQQAQPQQPQGQPQPSPQSLLAPQPAQANG